MDAERRAMKEAAVGADHPSAHRRAASAIVRAAREALGMDRDEFAARLDAELGWTVDARTIARWEQRSTPPGDVVAMCAGIADWPPELRASRPAAH